MNPWKWSRNKQVRLKLLTLKPGWQHRWWAPASLHGCVLIPSAPDSQWKYSVDSVHKYEAPNSAYHHLCGNNTERSRPSASVIGGGRMLSLGPWIWLAERSCLSAGRIPKGRGSDNGLVDLAKGGVMGRWCFYCVGKYFYCWIIQKYYHVNHYMH